MCYSKEVQLTTGSTILLFCLYYYIHYSIKYKAMEKKWLLPFLKYLIIAYAFIGGHQLFEFLSLASGNQIVYKIGLMLSITGMFFYLRSLEVLYNRNFYSKYFLIIMAAVAVHMFSVNMEFEATKFHLSHNSVFIWAAVWMAMFIYFHICAFKERKYLKEDISQKMIVLYVFSILDFSFLLSVAYTIWGYYKYNVNVCTESASIWCTFVVLQVFLMPIFLSFLPKALDGQSLMTKFISFFKKIFTRPPKIKFSKQKALFYFILSIIILAILVLILPFFNCLTRKFVFP